MLKSEREKFVCIAQAEFLCYKLLGDLAVPKACCGVPRFIMGSATEGYKVVVSEKFRGQRAKSMKFINGLMNRNGDSVSYCVDIACVASAAPAGCGGHQSEERASLGHKW